MYSSWARYGGARSETTAGLPHCRKESRDPGVHREKPACLSGAGWKIFWNQSVFYFNDHKE